MESRIDLNNRSRHEHRVLSKRLDLAFAHDGLNTQRLSCCEYLNRRRQLIEEAHREDPSRPNFEGAHIFMGEDEEVSGAYMAGALRAHVAAEMGKEAAILKERRKAREAKDAAAKATSAKNSGGKGE